MNLQSGRERRMSPRNPRVMAMRVYAYGVLVASGKTVDMSEHGLLLHIHEDFSDTELDPGKHLDVQLEGVEQPDADRWLPIKVVRKCSGGIAANFIRADTASV
jgi:hypothetical protein